MRRLGDEQRQHRLVAAMHAVEIADRQRRGGRQVRMAKTAKDPHCRDYRRRPSPQKRTATEPPTVQVRPGAGSKKRPLPSPTITEPT